jgi:TRAP-type mannitol/chloroaromatic compound transport system substrate-binding protein
MNRRAFLSQASLSAVAAGAVWASAPAVQTHPTYAWKMVTTWPKDFPGYGTGANRYKLS